MKSGKSKYIPLVLSLGLALAAGSVRPVYAETAQEELAAVEREGKALSLEIEEAEDKLDDLERELGELTEKAEENQRQRESQAQKEADLAKDAADRLRNGTGTEVLTSVLSPVPLSEEENTALSRSDVSAPYADRIAFALTCRTEAEFDEIEADLAEEKAELESEKADLEKEIKGLRKKKASLEEKKTELEEAVEAEEARKAAEEAAARAGESIVSYACRFVGCPYVWGGDSLTGGCDCSHFVYLVLRDCGAYSGGYMTSGGWAGAGSPVGSLAEARAGDVIVYSGHVAIYDGNGLIVEALNASRGIVHERRADSDAILAIRRFV